MLNFLNLKSLLSNIFCSSLQPQHTELMLTRATIWESMIWQIKVSMFMPVTGNQYQLICGNNMNPTVLEDVFLYFCEWHTMMQAGMTGDVMGNNTLSVKNRIQVCKDRTHKHLHVNYFLYHVINLTINKVHAFREGHKILRNLHRRFVLCIASQM